MKKGIIIAVLLVLIGLSVQSQTVMHSNRLVVEKLNETTNTWELVSKENVSMFFVFSKNAETLKTITEDDTQLYILEMDDTQVNDSIWEGDIISSRNVKFTILIDINSNNLVFVYYTNDGSKMMKIYSINR